MVAVIYYRIILIPFKDIKRIHPLYKIITNLFAKYIKDLFDSIILKQLVLIE